MNRYARNYLSMRDSRNPYGSRDGYVRDYEMRGSSRGRSGRDSMDRERDYRGSGRSGRIRDYARHEMDYRRDRARHEMDYNYYGDDRDYRDYEDDYGYDYDDEEEDYDFEEKLTEKDIKKWEKGLKNADGSSGKKFDTFEIKQIAKQHHIDFEKFSPELFSVIVNMMYADYCKVLGSDINLYVRMAKAFLMDSDFEGTPEEKAMLYYKCIVEKE